MSKILEPIEHEEYWELPIGGEKVVGLHIVSGFTLLISHPDYSLSIEFMENFLLSQGGQESILSSENPPSLAPGLDLIGKAIDSIRIGKTGSLEIFFSNQAKISVQPSERYEAWGILGGPNASGRLGLLGLRIYCMPGGGLAVWTPELNPEKWSL
ncbi:MAG: DUF6188 family protein [Anaerolineae bacterium]|nr:DUF6188 family protein [Anaerolineae bacterium]